MSVIVAFRFVRARPAPVILPAPGRQHAHDVRWRGCTVIFRIVPAGVVSQPCHFAGEGGRPLDVETRNDLRRTYTVVARLAHQGVSQGQLEQALHEIYRNGSDTMRAALRDSNEALIALGYSGVVYPEPG